MLAELLALPALLSTLLTPFDVAPSGPDPDVALPIVFIVLVVLAVASGLLLFRGRKRRPKDPTDQTERDSTPGDDHGQGPAE